MVAVRLQRFHNVCGCYFTFFDYCCATGPFVFPIAEHCMRHVSLVAMFHFVVGVVVLSISVAVPVPLHPCCWQFICALCVWRICGGLTSFEFWDMRGLFVLLSVF